MFPIKIKTAKTGRKVKKKEDKIHYLKSCPAGDGERE